MEEGSSSFLRCSLDNYQSANWEKPIIGVCLQRSLTFGAWIEAGLPYAAIWAVWRCHKCSLNSPKNRHQPLIVWITPLTTWATWRDSGMHAPLLWYSFRLIPHKWYTCSLQSSWICLFYISFTVNQFIHSFSSNSRLTATAKEMSNLLSMVESHALFTLIFSSHPHTNLSKIISQSYGKHNGKQLLQCIGL